jgi:hypothetical protein
MLAGFFVALLSVYLPSVSTIGVWGEILSGKCFKPHAPQLSTAGKISNIQKVCNLIVIG